MKKARKRLALLLLVALMALPAQVLAGGSILIAPDVEIGDTLPEFGRYRHSLGITASDRWLQQARIAGYSLNLRVHGANGDPVLFQEDLTRLSRGTQELRLTLRVMDTSGGATMQLDQRAADMFAYCGIEQIVLTDRDMRVIARYSLADIQALRDTLELGRGELLCLSGEDSPVTVVSVDGIRRQVDL